MSENYGTYHLLCGHDVQTADPQGAANEVYCPTCTSIVRVFAFTSRMFEWFGDNLFKKGAE